jgi:hypothetical protein
MGCVFKKPISTLDNTLVNSISLVKSKNAYSYMTIERLFYENTPKIYPYMVKFEQIKKYSTILNNFIDLMDKEDHEGRDINKIALIKDITYYLDSVKLLIKNTENLTTEEVKVLNKTMVEINIPEKISTDDIHTIFLKIKLNVEILMHQYVSLLLNQVDTSDKFRFYTIQAIANPGKTKVKINSPLNIEILLAKIDTTIFPDIFVEDEMVPVEKGKGVYSADTKKLGKFKKTGVLKIKSFIDTTSIQYPFEFEYEVVY